MSARYEVTPHRDTIGVLCPASMTVSTLPNGCPNGCPTPRFNMAMGDAAPSRLEVAYYVLASLRGDTDLPQELSAEAVTIDPYWDTYGAVHLRITVTRLGIPFDYTLTVDGDL